MKDNLLFIFFLLVFAGATAQKSPSTTENYITTTTCLSSDCAEKAVTVQYFDGLGRLKQVVDVAASPTGKDIVTPVKYDAFGRQDKDFLPLPQSGTEGGAIYPDGVGAAGEVYEQNGRLFAEKKFENSPLDRLLEQTAPGDAWNGRPVKFGYDTNTSNEVRKYTTTTVWANGATVSELNPADYYGAGELYKNTVSDEDGNVSIEFKNGRGQVLLIRKNDGNKNADTYYVYNEYDLLAFVIPPSAAASPALDTDTLDKLCYRYRYDGRGRLVEKQLPGKGPEYMVYDKQDRLVLVQDANQTGKQWNFTKYDGFGRVVYTGLFANTSTRKAMQSALDAMQANPGNNEKRSDTGFSLGGMTVYYTKEAFPKSSMTVLSVNYYDTYPPGSPAYTALISGQSVLTDSSTENISTKSLPTATYIRNIEDEGWTRSYFWYDTRGRNIATRSINHLGGYTLTESKLDFTGNPLASVTQHRRTADAAAVTVTENFFYGNRKRLEKHTHKVDGGAEEILAENTYNELGQLENKKVGGGLQSIDYRYNIRGWLTGINNPSELGGKLFGMTLNYNGPLLGVKRPNDEYPGLEIEPKYNGNIAEVRWNSGSGAKVYGYVYDGLSRLKAGFYQDSADPYAKENNEILVYDVNGNITELKRTARIFGNSVLMIDNLEYAYDGNRVTSITDHSKNKSGYEGGGNLITYDGNGNMTKMPDKKIDAIGYNHLNLPNAFVLPRNQSLSYTYRADGVKIAKRNMIGSPKTSTVVTDYLDGFQYSQKTDHGLIGSREAVDSDFAFEREAFEVDEVIELRTAPPTLEIFPTAEGFYDYQNKKYIYQYKDHLGNVRVSFARNQYGSAEVLDTNDYYPFGMNFLNSDLVSYLAQPWSKYKYNGKELQESGMYDYGARMYMPDIARWGVVDGLSEGRPNMSPYRYSFNNPVNATDSDGLWEDWVYNTKSNSIYWNDNARSQATAGANETYLGKSGTYTTQDGSTTALNSNGSFINNSLLGGLGTMNNLDPLIQAAANGPMMSYAAFGTANDPTVPSIRETPASNSPEVAMGNPSGQLAVAGLYGLQIGTADIAASKALGGLANFIGFGKGAGRIFWSGGDIAKNAAIDYATANGGRSLEMTWVGRGLEYATEKTSYNTMKPFWDYASYSFGRGVEGTANVFINQARYRSGSIWNTVERPLLQSRGININAHLIK